MFAYSSEEDKDLLGLLLPLLIVNNGWSKLTEVQKKEEKSLEGRQKNISSLKIDQISVHDNLFLLSRFHLSGPNWSLYKYLVPRWCYWVFVKPLRGRTLQEDLK